MKQYLSLAFLMFVLSACHSNAPETKAVSGVNSSVANTETGKVSKTTTEGVQVWQGIMNKKIPVLLAFRKVDDLICGQITYLNSKEHKPITVIGQIDQDGNYGLSEYEENGNISGIWYFTLKGNTIDGHWSAIKNDKQFPFSLQLKDTSVALPDVTFNKADMSGTYSYQYSKEGAQGSLDISELKDHRIAFGISCLTAPPAYNSAEISPDTVAFQGSSFRYKMPGTDSCEFEVNMYNGFVKVSYLRGYDACSDQFGFNASIEGVFIKVK